MIGLDNFFARKTPRDALCLCVEFEGRYRRRIEKKNASRQNVNPFYREDTGIPLLTSARRNATSDSDLLVDGQAVTENGAEYLYGKLNEDVMSFLNH